MKESFGIRVYKEYFNFAAAHFLIFEDGTREELHGHNYHVQMQAKGQLMEGNDVFLDFLHVKPVVKAMCDRIDHRTLLPRYNRYLEVIEREDEVEAIFRGSDRWIFPVRDVIVLPTPNTSAERLAQYLCVNTLQHVKEQYPDIYIQEVEFSVEESRGQSALYVLKNDSPVQLKDLVLDLSARFESITKQPQPV